MLTASIRETHLKLHGQRLGTEQMDYPCHPPLSFSTTYGPTVSPYSFFDVFHPETHGVRLIRDQLHLGRSSALVSP